MNKIENHVCNLHKKTIQYPLSITRGNVIYLIIFVTPAPISVRNPNSSQDRLSYAVIAMYTIPQ